MHKCRYSPLVPPLSKDISALSVQEAQAYFDWFVQQCPIRSKYIFSLAGHTDTSFEQIKYSSGSLTDIWKWFRDVAEVSVHKRSGEKRLSIQSEYMIRDIGMYLGETFVHNFDALHWGFHVKPKNDFFVNAPGIVGFADDHFSPPF